MDNPNDLTSRVVATISPMSLGKKGIDIDDLLKSGEWSWQDVPWVPEIVFDTIVKTAGSDDIHLIAQSSRNGWRRGQLLVTNAARARIGEAQEDLSSLFEKAVRNTPRPSSPAVN